METIIIEFLLGIAVGTISGLLIVKHTGNRMLGRRKLNSRRFRTPRQIMARPTRTRNVGRSLHRSRPRLTPQPSPTLTENPSLAQEQRSTVSSCPACGLQAPSALMAEHFLGSPSHEQGPLPIESKLAENNTNDESTVVATEEDSRSSVRHLLQMLVPPRAFGRRYTQRTVNPLSRLVQTLEDSQTALVRPLKRP